MELRPYQVQSLRLISATPLPHRFLLTYDTGVGKTPAAVMATVDAMAAQVLVVCPAMMRRTWAREFELWHPAAVSVGVIEYGRNVKLSKIKSIERDLAYNASVQIVSYDLVGQVNAVGWDYIILDEIHHLQNPLSIQSKRISKLVKINSEAHTIGLTATLEPNEIKNVWHPLHLLWPGDFGQPSRSGGISWAFLAKHCYREENQYGVRYYGTLPGAAEKLAKQLGPRMHRVTKADALAYLPLVQGVPLFVHSKASPVAIGVDWARETCATDTHIGIFTHLRSSAEQLAAKLKAKGCTPVFIAHGGHTTKYRDELMQAARASDRAVFIGTTHAFLEGIDLSFLSRVLVAEWTSRPADLVQFIGRFGRGTASHSTVIQYLIREGTNDEARLLYVQQKLQAISELYRLGHGETVLSHVFTAQELSDDQFFQEMQAMLYNQGLPELKGDLEDEDASEFPSL